MPTYAECGGLLYLGRSLTGFDGERHAMSGVLPLDAQMDPSAPTRAPSRDPLGGRGRREIRDRRGNPVLRVRAASGGRNATLSCEVRKGKRSKQRIRCNVKKGERRARR